MTTDTSYSDTMDEPKEEGKKKKKRIIIILALLLLLLLLAIVGGIVYPLLIKESETEVSAMLRLISGDTQVYDADTGNWTGASDETLLNAGDKVQVAEDSIALIQYYGGAMSLLTGPAEVELASSIEIKKGIADPTYSSKLKILSGQVTAELIADNEQTTYLRLVAPNSAAAITNDILEVQVNENESAYWSTTRGNAYLAALVPNSDRASVAALVILNSGESMLVPPLPEAWSGESQIDGLINTVSNIAEKSVKEDSSNITVSNADLISRDDTTGTALFQLKKGQDLSTPPAPTTAIPTPLRDLITDDILSSQTPSLAITHAPVIYYTAMPYLPFPDGWVTIPDMPDTPQSPPSHVFAIYDVDHPFGVAYDAIADRLLVTEATGDRSTKIFDLSGELINTITPPSTTNLNRIPFYAAVNKLGNIYVSDPNMRHTIDIYNSDGLHMGNFESGGIPEMGWSPAGIAFDPTGNLHVTDLLNHQILIFNSEGNLILAFGSPGDEPKQFNFPHPITIDANGWMYVAERTNMRGQVFSTSGSPETIFPYKDTKITAEFILPSSTLGVPGGLAVDQRGCLYATSNNGNNVNVYDATKRMTSLFSFGQAGLGNADFSGPGDIAIDSAGKIYIADGGHDRVLVWDY